MLVYLYVLFFFVLVQILNSYMFFLFNKFYIVFMSIIGVYSRLLAETVDCLVCGCWAGLGFVDFGFINQISVFGENWRKV